MSDTPRPQQLIHRFLPRLHHLAGVQMTRDTFRRTLKPLRLEAGLNDMNYGGWIEEGTDKGRPFRVVVKKRAARR